MKKILSYIVFGAMVLFMAGCNEGNVADLKHFKVNIDDISYESVEFEIETTDPNLLYVAGIDYKNTFFRLRESSIEALANFQERKGDSHMEIEHLLIPETEYVWYAIIIDENGDKIGDVEYMSFKTPAIEIREPEKEEGKVNIAEYLRGVVYVPEENDVPYNAFAIVAECTHLDEKAEASLGFIGQDLLSSYNTEDLGRSFCYMNPCLTYTRSGQDPIAADIYKADIKGSHDDKTDRYIFEGYVIVFNQEMFYDEEGNPWGAKIPVRINCEKKVAEPK